MPRGLFRVLCPGKASVGRLDLPRFVSVHGPERRHIDSLPRKRAIASHDKQAISYTLSRQPVTFRDVSRPVLFIADGNVKAAVLVVGKLVVTRAGRDFVLDGIVEAGIKRYGEIATFGHFWVSEADAVIEGEIAVDRQEVVGIRQGAERADQGLVVVLWAAGNVREGCVMHW